MSFDEANAVNKHNVEISNLFQIYLSVRYCLNCLLLWRTFVYYNQSLPSPLPSPLSESPKSLVPSLVEDVIFFVISNLSAFKILAKESFDLKLSEIGAQVKIKTLPIIWCVKTQFNQLPLTKLEVRKLLENILGN